MVNIKVLTLALSLAASSIAVAGSGGPYLGGQATYSFYDESIDAEGYGYKVYGGYRFGVGNALDYFAVEASWQDFGEFEGLIGGVPFLVPSSKVEIDIDGFTLDVLGFIPIGDSDEFFGKVGYYDADDDVRVDGIKVRSSGDAGLNLGVGVQSELGSASLRLELTWFMLDEGDIWSLGFGAQWNFGASQ